MGLEPTSREATNCFQDSALTNSDGFRCDLALRLVLHLCKERISIQAQLLAPGVGIEPTTFCFRGRRNYQPLLPRSGCDE